VERATLRVKPARRAKAMRPTKAAAMTTHRRSDGDIETGRGGANAQVSKDSDGS
jgi:hypothetical protein